MNTLKNLMIKRPEHRKRSAIIQLSRPTYSCGCQYETKIWSNMVVHLNRCIGEDPSGDNWYSEKEHMKNKRIKVDCKRRIENGRFVPFPRPPSPENITFKDIIERFNASLNAPDNTQTHI